MPCPARLESTRRHPDAAARVAPGPAGSYDELYAHKPVTISYGGRLLHYYTCVMAGSTFRRIALATDPALPTAGATVRTALAVTTGRFAQGQTPPEAGNTPLAPSTSFVPLPNLVSARVQAKAGDLLELNFACVLANDGGDARIDAATYNGTSVINLVSGLAHVEAMVLPLGVHRVVVTTILAARSTTS